MKKKELRAKIEELNKILIQRDAEIARHKQYVCHGEFYETGGAIDKEIKKLKKDLAKSEHLLDVMIEAHNALTLANQRN